MHMAMVAYYDAFITQDIEVNDKCTYRCLPEAVAMTVCLRWTVHAYTVGDQKKKKR